jgi:hypothetical protein
MDVYVHIPSQHKDHQDMPILARLDPRDARRQGCKHTSNRSAEKATDNGKSDTLSKRLPFEENN